jgi:HemK-related putative methylase
MVYTPEEDSYLILDCLKKELTLFSEPKKIRLLDMGTGSGIISLNFYNLVNFVYAVDIDKNVISFVKNKINSLNNKNKKKIKNIHLIRSNLFSNLKVPNLKFDLISFNPPYLPNEKKIKNDVALNGGKQGYETIFKFLEQAKDYLSINGRILLLFSSFSKRNKILKHAKTLGYNYKLIVKKRIFFEILYVYRFKPKEYFFSKGHRGKIYYFEKNKKKFIKKIALKKSNAKGNIANEAKFNKLLNKHGLAPKFVVYNKKQDYLIREYVEGVLINDYLLTHSKKQILLILNKIFDKLLLLDNLGINKFELTNPYKHIIIDKNNVPYMIDFERCRFTDNPKNVTQFLQYLSSNQLKNLLRKKNIIIKKSEIINLSKEYKKNLDSALIKKFLNFLD